MLARLGSQAREIMLQALNAERDENFRSFGNYNAFRRKVGEFESFCSIIEGYLKEVVSERREELEERFYSLWQMIFRPTLKALGAFFARMSKDGVLPLGCRDILSTELRALEAMRTALLAPRFAASADKATLDEIAALEGTIRALMDQATSLPDFSTPPADDAPDAAQPDIAPAAGRTSPVALRSDDSAQVRAVREIPGPARRSSPQRGIRTLCRDGQPGPRRDRAQIRGQSRRRRGTPLAPPDRQRLAVAPARQRQGAAPDPRPGARRVATSLRRCRDRSGCRICIPAATGSPACRAASTDRRRFR